MDSLAASSNRSASTSSSRSWRSLLGATLGFALACCVGCASGPRVALVPYGHILRAGPDVRGRVYVENAEGEWTLSANEVHVPEGWYLVDHPGAVQ